METFGQQGGLIIDTRDLFRLPKAVASGSVDAEAVRAMLMGATGRFDFLQTSARGAWLVEIRTVAGPSRHVQ